MSTLKVLKEYLVGEGGYLLNDDNNGKTVMLSGAWGSGKTHFWQNDIVRRQSKIIVNKRKRNKYSAKELKEGLFALLKKKKKTCVYISLYGKDNIEDIKSEVFTKAYAQISKKGNKDKNIDTAIEWLGYGSKIASAVSIFGVRVDTTKITDGAKDYQDNEKLSEAQEAIRDGGVICFDDFERKSKNIDLNDLFGVLTQLSLEFNCKVIIILNSEAFKEDDSNIFKTVKEKTVNKYFYFNPTRIELFNAIYVNDEKYKTLDEYREIIFNAINETEELNARIYVQVLDNCLEWILKGYEATFLRTLALVTINFVLNNIVLSYKSNVTKPASTILVKMKKILPTISNNLIFKYTGVSLSNEDTIIQSLRDTSFSFKYVFTYVELQKYSEEIIRAMSQMDIVLKEQKDIVLSIEDTYKILERYILNNFNNSTSMEIKEIIMVELKKYKSELFAIWKYGYRLYSLEDINEKTYNVLIDYVKSGVLLSDTTLLNSKCDNNQKMIIL